MVFLFQDYNSSVIIEACLMGCGSFSLIFTYVCIVSINNNGINDGPVFVQRGGHACNIYFFLKAILLKIIPSKDVLAARRPPYFGAWSQITFILNFIIHDDDIPYNKIYYNTCNLNIKLFLFISLVPMMMGRYEVRIQGNALC